MPDETMPGAPEGPLGTALLNQRILVCVGAGGVGKTTSAAALALVAALQGRRAVVCTIDPARRLAQALGLERLGNEATPVSLLPLQSGAPTSGELWAMMLDMKKAWDQLIVDRAPPAVAQKILANPYYQSLSTSLAGSQEYVALEKLGALAQDPHWDLLVLDTPPTGNALDFFKAPRRILNFVEGTGTTWFLKPALSAGKMGLKVFAWGGKRISAALSQFTGADTLQQLADFMLSMTTLHRAFQERALQTEALLRRPDTSLVLITSPTPERVDATCALHALLQQQGMNLAAVVVNRVHPRVPADAWPLVDELPDPTLRAKMASTLAEMRLLAEADEHVVQDLAQRLPQTPVLPVPNALQEVDELEGLFSTGRALQKSAAAKVG